jgi:hypothetical protein
MLVVGVVAILAAALAWAGRTVWVRSEGPPATRITGVTPAQLNVAYFFCFDADDEVKIEPRDMITDYKYDARGNSVDLLAFTGPLITGKRRGQDLLNSGGESAAVL